MAKRFSQPKTSTINQSRPAEEPDLSAFYPDLDDWPRSWRGTDDDILPGERIVDCFRPFLRHMAARYSRKTIRKHAGNLWVLGGEIIRDLYESPRLRKASIETVLFDVVQGGGPLPHHWTSQDQLQSFESTCRKLSEFLQRQREAPPAGAPR
jgi:hypothetical protein